ncbi:MAG TPA: hypothetical protein VKT82_04080 [Ktedonobacterales bacterium]|nr:hypothetical protein [Ktedonobacterales bacterium]
MAQANPNQQGGTLERFTFRTIALIVGLVGTVIAFIINILYSLAHVLGRVTGITNDASHFWWGILVVIVALIGSFLAPIWAIGAAILLLASGIAFFWIVGWWAIIASVFLFVAALLTFSNRRVRVPGMA